MRTAPGHGWRADPGSGPAKLGSLPGSVAATGTGLVCTHRDAYSGLGWRVSRPLVPRPVHRGAAERRLRRTRLPRHPARRGGRGPCRAAARGRLAVPRGRRSAGIHHQCRTARTAGRWRLRAAVPARGAGRPDHRRLDYRVRRARLGTLPGAPGGAAARRARVRGRPGNPAAGPVRVCAGRGPRRVLRLACGGRAHRTDRRRGGRLTHPGDRAAPP